MSETVSVKSCLSVMKSRWVRRSGRKKGGFGYFKGAQPMGWMALKRGLSSCGQAGSLGMQKRSSRAESTRWKTVLHSRIRKSPPMRRRPDKRTKVPRHISGLCSGTALRDVAKSRQIVQMLRFVTAAGGTKHRHKAQERMWVLWGSSDEADSWCGNSAAPLAACLGLD